jgi:hypothetical protein
MQPPPIEGIHGHLQTTVACAVTTFVLFFEILYSFNRECVCASLSLSLYIYIYFNMCHVTWQNCLCSINRVNATLLHK